MLLKELYEQSKEGLDSISQNGFRFKVEESIFALNTLKITAQNWGILLNTGWSKKKFMIWSRGKVFEKF